MPEAFFQFNVNLMSIYVLQGVGKKVRIRELMGIASADENDDHVISVKKYDNLKDAIKKAVDIKIGTSNGLSSIFFIGLKILFSEECSICRSPEETNILVETEEFELVETIRIMPIGK